MIDQVDDLVRVRRLKRVPEEQRAGWGGGGCGIILANDGILTYCHRQSSPRLCWAKSRIPAPRYPFSDATMRHPATGI